MKKIIDGKKYDTQTAKLLYQEYGYYEYGDCATVKQYFQKTTGECFTYESLTEDGTSNEFKAYSEEAMKSILVKLLIVDEYEAIFGEVSE